MRLMMVNQSNADIKLPEADSSCQVPAYGCVASFPCHIRKKYLASGVSKYRGELCRGCPWWQVLPFTCLNGYESEILLDHRRCRFFVRAFRGVACGIAKKYRFRWFVLTESDEALTEGIEFGPEFHRFLMWLRLRCPDFQYIVVEHRQGDKQRRNWHILSYGSDRLPVLAMRDYWLEHFKSTLTGMAEVRDIDKAVRYLAKYLSKRDGFVRSWCSQGWVFRGWLGISRQYRRVNGGYPDESELTKLSLMSPVVKVLCYTKKSGYIVESKLVKV